MKLLWCVAVAVVLMFGLDPAKSFGADPTPPAAAPAAAAPTLNGADTAWMLVSSALVLMMTAPGLALFYGGLVRKKNILGVMMQCFFMMGILSVLWALVGYSLAFDEEHLLGGFIGGKKYMLMDNVMPTWDAATKTATVPLYGTIPRSVHLAFQGMFFIITPCLICGAFAERMKFSAMVVYTVLWGLLIYCPIAHWVWADTGWLNSLNKDAVYPALDFAGGTVVHISSGMSALVCALLLGKRLGFGQEPMPPHNLTYTCIGAALLWVGWFGFNAGSALTSGAAAANAFLATHLAAAMGTVAWAGLEWLTRGKPSILGACSGAVAGLVCITPACGSVTPLAGILLGLIAGVVCFWACTTLKSKGGYDDSLDAFGVHGVGGTAGALLTGVFASPAILGATGYDFRGVLFGNPKQLLNQGVAVGCAIALAIVGSLILLKLLDAVIGLRVSQQDEIQGLDLSQHGEEGYIFY
ncbi:MAG: ammonium transporter [Planctomycetaceae bacterium]